MMKFSSKLTVWVVGTVAVFSGALSVVVFSTSAKVLREKISSRLEDSSGYVMDMIDRMLFERANDIRSLTEEPVIQSAVSSPKAIRKYLLRILRDYKYYASIALFAKDGTKIADTTGMNIGEKIKGGRSWEDALSGKESFASEIEFSEELNMPVIYFAAPVRNGYGNIYRVIRAQVPINKLYDMIKVLNKADGIGANLSIELVDQNNLLLYSSVNPQGVLKDSYANFPPAQAARQGRNKGSLIYTDPNRRDQQVAAFARETGYLDFSGNGWTLIVHVSTKLIFAPASKLRNMTTFFLCVMLVCCVILMLALTNKMARPLKILQKRALEISARSGDLTQMIEITTQDEIGGLAASFNKVLESLRGIVTQNRNYSLEISAAAAQIFAATREQASGANQQASAVNQASTTVKELAVTAAQIAQNAENVAKTAERTMAGMQEINIRVDGTAKKILALGDKSQAIGNTFVKHF
ncbi:MAG: methyl-accepting chemotaxis protein, partial [Candidatus Omnitrophica bacterium]|nr:methyl-accepting chemotaxis protein [Candidatus Omnitrophota bacterium]